MPENTLVVGHKVFQNKVKCVPEVLFREGLDDRIKTGFQI